MAGSEREDQGVPVDIPLPNPVTFGEYYPTQSEANPAKIVGVIPLNAAPDIREGWVTDLQAVLVGRKSDYRYSNTPLPGSNFPVNRFVVRRVGGNMQVRLQGLDGLKTPITLAMTGERVEIRFPLDTQEERRGPRDVIEMHGPAFWGGIPAKIKGVYDRKEGPGR